MLREDIFAVAPTKFSTGFKKIAINNAFCSMFEQALYSYRIVSF